MFFSSGYKSNANPYYSIKCITAYYQLYNQMQNMYKCNRFLSYMYVILHFRKHSSSNKQPYLIVKFLFVFHTLCCRSALPHTTVCGSALYKGGGKTYL